MTFWCVCRVAVILLLVLFVIGCRGAEEATPTPTIAGPQAASTPTGAPSPGEPQHGGVIKGVNQAGAQSLDNLFTSLFATRNVAAHMYETVVTFDADYAIKPRLADWEISGDNTVYTFTIRPGAKYHDGSAVTSNDILAVLDRYSQAQSPTSLFGVPWGVLDKSEAVNDQTVRLTFQKPVVTMLNALAAMAGQVPHIMPARIASVTPHNQSVTEYVGSGPYKLKNWVRGDRVELERFEGYVDWDEPTSGFAGKRPQYLDEIWFMEVPDQATRLAGLEAGNLDYVFEISNDFYDRLNDNNDIVVSINDPGVRPFIWFNHENSPTDNPDIRRAIVTAIDTEAALLAAGGGPEFFSDCGVQAWCVDGVDPITGPINWADLTAGMDLYGQNDKDLARKLAQDAGYNGEKITILGVQDVSFLFAVGQIMEQDLRQAGFNVELTAADYAAQQAKAHDATGWSIYIVDQSWANSVPGRFRSAPVSSFISRYKPSTRMQELAQLVAFETDPTKHRQWLNEIQKLAQEEAGCCYMIGQLKTISAQRTWVKGYEPWSVMWLANTWLDK